MVTYYHDSTSTTTATDSSATTVVGYNRQVPVKIVSAHKTPIKYLKKEVETPEQWLTNRVDEICKYAL